MKIPLLPKNFEEFRVMYDEMAGTPEGAAALFVIALKMYAENPETGYSCIMLMRETNDLRKSASRHSFQGYTMCMMELSLLESQLSSQPYLPDSYFNGAWPTNNYLHGDRDQEIDISSNPYSGDASTGRFKVFVRSSGADTPRPVLTVKNEDGHWKVKEYSSLIIGIRKAAREERSVNL